MSTCLQVALVVLRNSVSLQAAKLKQATESGAAYSDACQELETKLAAAFESTAHLTQQHLDQTEAHNKHASDLDQELQAVKATISQFEADLETALANTANAEANNQTLRLKVTEHEVQLQAVQEQLENTKQSLSVQTATYETLSEEHDQLKAKHDELSLALQAAQDDLLVKLSEIEQLTVNLVAETSAKVYILALQHSCSELCARLRTTSTRTSFSQACRCMAAKQTTFKTCVLTGCSLNRLSGEAAEDHRLARHHHSSRKRCHRVEGNSCVPAHQFDWQIRHNSTWSSLQQQAWLTCRWKMLTACALQENHTQSLADLEAKLSASKADTATAKADAEAAIKEASTAGDKKIRHLSERTAKVSCLPVNRLTLQACSH